MPFLMSFALEPEIVALAWIDNAFVQFPLNFYATKGFRHIQRPPLESRNRGGCTAIRAALALTKHQEPSRSAP